MKYSSVIVFDRDQIGVHSYINSALGMHSHVVPIRLRSALSNALSNGWDVFSALNMWTSSNKVFEIEMIIFLKEHEFSWSELVSNKSKVLHLKAFSIEKYILKMLELLIIWYDLYPRVHSDKHVTKNKSWDLFRRELG